MVKNPPANSGIIGDTGNPWVGKIPWRKEMATHSSILARRIPMDRSLVGSSPWGHKELDMTE